MAREPGENATNFSWRDVSDAATRGMPLFVVLMIMAAVCGLVWLLRPDEPAARATTVLLMPNSTDFHEDPIPGSLFEHKRADLKPDGVAQLKTIAEALKKKGVDEVIVIGLADVMGDPGENDVLSQNRADTVKLELGKVLDAEDIAAVGVGSHFSRTGGTCDTMEREAKIACLAQDRRVEIWSRKMPTEDQSESGE